MKQLLLGILISILGVACAHHDTNENVDHHHHNAKQASFDGQCAYSLAHHEPNVEGKKEFSFEHKGMTYYFSSEEKMNAFKKDLDRNIRAANEYWGRGAGRR